MAVVATIQRSTSPQEKRPPTMPRSPRSDKSFYEAVGRRIREARKGKITQAALASVVSLTRTSIVNIEQGRQQLFVHTLVNIAQALRVPVADLIPITHDASSTDLPAVLQGQPRKVQEWITTAVNAARNKE